ncbi:GrpB family protein [Paenibacillus senegalensis]|uniref:GrpB family protein n=1 Tax=Paenibacillus senegalensis TaxID=1465766 RepID=UPI0002885D23|nr:GrpB family protein [Paenibacillus senegalensis]
MKIDEPVHLSTWSVEWKEKYEEEKKRLSLVFAEWGSTIWKDNLLFRDYLRSHPEEAKEYSKIKEIAITKGYNTLLKYSEEKSDVIQQIMNHARKWNDGGRNVV